MTLEPLLSASPAIHIHVVAVVTSALLGAYVLLRRKGTRLHRMLGKIWLLLMAVGAFSSFFIHELNVFHGFSPIHLLSVFVLYSCVQAIVAARRHDIARHRRVVLGLYFGGIGGAGAFTLLPHRIMNAVVFTGHETMPLLLLVAMALFLAWAAWGARSIPV